MCIEQEEDWTKDAELWGTLEGFDVYVKFSEDGLDFEEAVALYSEAVSDSLYQKLICQCHTNFDKTQKGKGE